MQMTRILASLLFGLTLSAAAPAHHNTQAEYGSFGAPYIYVEGRITDIQWGNPHIRMDIEVTGGDLPTGETWTLNSHPVRVMEAYGFSKEEFAVGDNVRLHTWTHLRGIPHLWPRAIQVNDGPMKSNLRFTDMIDIANGSFEELGIVPAANLNGSEPQRAGVETVEKLSAMGLLDENGLVIWPPAD